MQLRSEDCRRQQGICLRLLVASKIADEIHYAAQRRPCDHACRVPVPIFQTSHSSRLLKRSLSVSSSEAPAPFFANFSLRFHGKAKMKRRAVQFLLQCRVGGLVGAPKTPAQPVAYLSRRPLSDTAKPYGGCDRLNSSGSDGAPQPYW